MRTKEEQEEEGRKWREGGKGESLTKDTFNHFAVWSRHDIHVQLGIEVALSISLSLSVSLVDRVGKFSLLL